ncbi:uncharacterized protein LOC135696706 [Rhopilema esculentum]|uniref:uncharacterized protein LOC135696706 n=1 Tax=Rhopilema esculentum TaxID=499914 RepID=UPI0031DF1CD2|eukprot:gene12882-3632_t
MGCAPSKNSNQVVVNSHSRPQPRQEEKQLLLQSSPNKSAANTDTTDFNQNSDTDNVRSGAVQEIKQDHRKEVTDRPAESSVQKSSPVKKTSEKSADIQKISYEKASQLLPQNPDEMWAIVKGTSDKVGIHIEPLKNRKGWRTIRIFVSSTFKDFHQEREVLVKEVFPDLRLWCEQRKLRLVECDLRWGVPKDATTEETIKICLSELDRCYEDNTAPFFLNLAGDRSGWIPTIDDLSRNLAAQYGWVYGLSVTEMEIVHGAFRKLNPNALFMFRKTINDLPETVKEDFIDTDPKCVQKVKTLKHVIQSQFPESRIYNYDVKSVRNKGDVLEFCGLNDSRTGFGQKAYDFFLQRIEELYPLDPSPEDPLQVQREAHETFLDSRSQCVLGRDGILEQMHSYVTSPAAPAAPLLIIGTAGAGKSAVMAKAAADAVRLAKENKIPLSNGYKKCRVFFHFVGATPGSTDLAFFLQRLTKEVKPDLKDIVSDLESLIQLSGSLLSNPNTEPVILFIDAVNQLDEDKQHFLNRWLPETLAKNVKVVVSMIEGTPTHRMMRAYKTNPKEIICGPLDLTSRQAIVENILSQYNKRLDQQQMDTLLHKEGSSNPLWLTLACEELRVFGKFEELLEKIHSLPNDLISLEIDVFSRFEEEAGGQLMIATLCLLEVSRHGLLETELLALLGDKNNLKPPEYVEGEEAGIVAKTEDMVQSDVTVGIEKDDVEKLTEQFAKLVNDAYVVKDDDDKNDKDENKNKRKKGKQIQFLPAREWAIIYRNLKQLLRPCGDLGEGRLDFYHRSLSKAVRRKYFTGTDEYNKHVYNYWHGVLAGYFEHVDDMDRKAEELPYHLEQLLDNNRLIRCLLEWPVFNRLFSEDFSIDLLHSWRKAGGYSVASALYKESCKVLKRSGISLIDYGDQLEKVVMFLIQAGQYEDAYTMLEERLEIEEEQLGKRGDELADIYQLMGKCKSEVVKNYNFVTRDQLEEDKEVVEFCMKSLEYRKKMRGEEHEFKAAMTNVLVAHHLSIIADLEPSKGAQHRQQAFKAVDEAIATFEKIGDIGHLAEAIMTKSFVNPRSTRFFSEKKVQLEKSSELCMKAYGEKHLLACRLYLNIGILYEDNRDFEMAYDYFVKWNECCLVVLGADHPKSIRAKDTLAEPTYIRIRQAREKIAAGSA